MQLQLSHTSMFLDITDNLVTANIPNEKHRELVAHFPIRLLNQIPLEMHRNNANIARKFRVGAWLVQFSNEMFRFEDGYLIFIVRVSRLGSKFICKIM